MDVVGYFFLTHGELSSKLIAEPDIDMERMTIDLTDALPCIRDTYRREIVDVLCEYTVDRVDESFDYAGTHCTGGMPGTHRVYYDEVSELRILRYGWHMECVDIWGESDNTLNLIEHLEAILDVCRCEIEKTLN